MSHPSPDALPNSQAHSLPKPQPPSLAQPLSERILSLVQAAGAVGMTPESLLAQLADASRSTLNRRLALLVSQGTPMLLAGDEIGHSQRGNNNAYCQDNPLTWLDWAGADEALLQEVRAWLALRQAHPLLRSAAWWRESHHEGASVEAIWWHPAGRRLEPADWSHGQERAIALTLRDGPAQAPLCLLFNPQAQACEFHLPPGLWSSGPCSTAALGDPGVLDPAAGVATVPARAVWALRALPSAGDASPSH